MNEKWYCFNDSRCFNTEFSSIFKNYKNYKYVYNLFYEKYYE